MISVVIGNPNAPQLEKLTLEPAVRSQEPKPRDRVTLCWFGAKVSQFADEKPFILVVEDDELIRMHAADMVRDLGFEAIEASNADHAISLLESRSDILVVFADIQMPGSMDGLHLVAVVRDRWPPIALLVTSGQVSPPASSLPPGARFVSKPDMSHELGTHLSALTGFGFA
jgi:CheY-like chemotaxis protein